MRQLVGKRITFCRDCGYGWEKADGLPIYLLRYKTLPDQLRYLAGKLISTAERIDDPPQRFEIGAVSFCLHMLADTLVIDGDAAP